MYYTSGGRRSTLPPLPLAALTAKLSPMSNTNIEGEEKKDEGGLE
jgi:hypothetical protein